MTLCMNARTLTQCSPGPGPNRRCTLATHFLLAKFQLRHIVRLSLEESGAPQMSLSSESRNEASDSGISPASNITPRLSLRAGLKAQGCHLHGPAFVLVPWGDWALLDTSTTSHAFSAAWVSRMGDQMTWSFVSLNREGERETGCVYFHFYYPIHFPTNLGLASGPWTALVVLVVASLLLILRNPILTLRHLLVCFGTTDHFFFLKEPLPLVSALNTREVFLPLLGPPSEAHRQNYVLQRVTTVLLPLPFLFAWSVVKMSITSDT